MKPLDWQTAKTLESRFGDAVYLLDHGAFEQNYKDFLSSFREIYANSNIAYSYKTNYIPLLCRTVDNLGGYAEVVSRMEYELACKLGVDPSRIIFNGPYKSAGDIELALKSGSVLNIDSIAEVDIIESLASSINDKTLRIGLRCNLEIDPSFDSRFGLDVNNGDLDDAIERLRACKPCEIVGLHCHYSVFREARTRAQLTRSMLELHKKHWPDSPLDFIDMGGGYYSRMPEELRSQFESNIEDYQDYANAIATEFAKQFPDGNGPELILEPGIALTADVMKFLCKVVAIKHVGNRTCAQLTGSIQNLKQQAPQQKNLPIEVISKDERNSVDVGTDFVGYTCMENDVLYSGYEKTVKIGDYVLFSNIGAYSFVLKPPFIKLCPAMVTFNRTSEEFELLRRAETNEDLFGLFEDLTAC